MAGETVYVIEDDNDLRGTLVNTLRAKGYIVKDFLTVDKVLEYMGYDAKTQQVAHDIPDIFLTDYDTESRYKGIHVLMAANNANVPSIMLTSSMGITRAMVTDAGGEHARLLRKGFIDRVPEEIREALDQRTRSNPSEPSPKQGQAL